LTGFCSCASARGASEIALNLFKYIYEAEPTSIIDAVRKAVLAVKLFLTAFCLVTVKIPLEENWLDFEKVYPPLLIICFIFYKFILIYGYKHFL
jgi:hypothetical protein